MQWKVSRKVTLQCPERAKAKKVFDSLSHAVHGHNVDPDGHSSKSMALCCEAPAALPSDILICMLCKFNKESKVLTIEMQAVSTSEPRRSVADTAVRTLDDLAQAMSLFNL